MENRFIEGLRKDIAERYINLYERLNILTGTIGALGKAIEVLSLQDNSGEVELGFFGNLIEEKCREIDTLLDGFISYPSVYLALKKGEVEYA